MNSRKFLFTTALAGFLSISAMASAEKAISKPAGAKGTGKVSAFQAKSNSFWWPDQLNLQPLRAHSPESNPYGEDFDYAEEFDQLDIDAVKKDIDAVLTDSQDWWPADYGNYGPFFIRMAWHSAGTYRTADGRGGAGGGQQRFEPLNSWPDNGNLDKARRLLWPVKQKYGRQLSWADLMVLAGNVAMENMGFKTLGFAGGRADDWEPDIVYWGPEVEMLASDRENKGGKLQRPLGATHMGLIYVNPEGPKGIPDAEKSAHNIRTAFGRMAMNDEETVALVAGGHTFGKMHGAGKASKYVGAEPAAAPVEEQGFGWKNSLGKGHSEDTITSGIEGAWTSAPVQWTHMYLQNLMNNDWEQTKGPGGGIHWEPKDKESNLTVPDAHIEDKYHVPVMTTADMALKVDPEYHKISKRFLDNPEEFEKAFASAWFKLTHRDMGPRARYIGKYVPSDVFSWQDPVPKAGHVISVGEADVLKKRILSSGLSIPELVRVAWASGSSFRDTDLRGGANGARIALAPQKDWEVNNPEEAAKVVAKLKEVQDNFGKNVPLADLIVLGGAAAIEKAAKDAGYYNLKVPFKAGRGDATQAQTDVKSFAELEPKADGFRNYYTDESLRSPAEALVDKADTLGLTVPEMTVLVGGLRSLDANYQGSKNGVFTDKPGALSNDFFVNLLDMSTKWEKSGTEGIYNGVDRKTGEKKYTATPVDLAFGSNSELRAVAEVYAASDAKDKFAKDFVAAWVKVMNADRF